MSDENKELSKKVADLLEKISELTLVEASELVSAMEEKFGISAAAPVAVAGAVAAAGNAEEEEEKSEYNVVITALGDGAKIKVIKAVRTINQALGLKEAKELVEDLPGTVAENAKKEDAENMKKVLEEAGATVELK